MSLENKNVINSFVDFDWFLVQNIQYDQVIELTYTDQMVQTAFGKVNDQMLFIRQERLYSTNNVAHILNDVPLRSKFTTCGWRNDFQFYLHWDETRNVQAID